MASGGPGRWVSPDDYSSVPSVLSWFLGAICVLCVAIKFVTKLSMERAFGKDDVAIILSTLISVGFVAAVSFACKFGVGKPLSTLSTEHIQAMEQSIYAGNLTYIASLFFSKTAVLFLLRALTPVPRHLMLIWSTGGLITAWALSSIFVVAFQCPLPSPWSILSGRCLDQNAFWIYSNSMNMVTELCLCGIPLFMFKTVKMRLSTKVMINTIFVLRFLILGPIIAEIYFRQQIGYSNQSFSLWTVTLCMTITQSLSIIFACAPFLKPFFAALETGMVRLDDTRRLSATTLYSESGAKTEAGLLPKHKHKSNGSGSGNDSGHGSGHGGNSQPSAHSRSRNDYGFTPQTSQGWTEISRASSKSDRETPEHDEQAILATTTFSVRLENNGVDAVDSAYDSGNNANTTAEAYIESNSHNQHEPAFYPLPNTNTNAVPKSLNTTTVTPPNDAYLASSRKDTNIAKQPRRLSKRNSRARKEMSALSNLYHTHIDRPKTNTSSNTNPTATTTTTTDYTRLRTPDAPPRLPPVRPLSGFSGFWRRTSTLSNESEKSVSELSNRSR